MIIKTLVENTVVSDEFQGQHGLSLYIETKHHKILFDTGADGLFAENAKKLNVNLEEVDLAVISHGHYDHGGGLKTFLQENDKAEIYINQNAFSKLYAKGNEELKYIGLDENLKNDERIVFAGDYLKIDDELEVFSGVKGRQFFSLANKTLLTESENGVAEDTFNHEQNLIITENGKTTLLAGCAHNGVVNIVNKFREIKGKDPDYLIGGFHLFNRGTGESEDVELVTQIAEYLNTTDTLYYSCHCTGIEAFEQLKNIMKDKLQYIATGSIIKI